VSRIMCVITPHAHLSGDVQKHGREKFLSFSFLVPSSPEFKGLLISPDQSDGQILIPFPPFFCVCPGGGGEVW
jgi:hypothetical protein